MFSILYLMIHFQLTLDAQKSPGETDHHAEDWAFHFIFNRFQFFPNLDMLRAMMFAFSTIMTTRCE